MMSVILKCSSCEETDLELYYCETCFLSTDDNAMLPAVKELLCEICLGPHIRKRHDVRLSNGQEALVCSQHRRLHSDYCRTCDVTFCGSCLGNHSEHKMGTIDERAIEIKKKVFEMLTKLELDEKPLRAKKEAVSECVKRCESGQLKLKELFEKEIEALRQLGLKQIDENLKKIKFEEEEICNGIDHVLDLQSCSRNLLVATNPHLIHDFKRVNVNFLQTSRNCEHILLSNIYSEPPNFSSVKEEISKFSQNVSEELKIVFEKTYKSDISKSFAIQGADWSRFFFTVENGVMKISRIVVSDFDIPRKKFLTEVKFDEKVKQSFSIKDDSFSCSCVVITESDITYQIQVDKKRITKISKLAMPSVTYLLCAFATSLDNKIRWCYWDEDRKVIKLTPDLDFPCSSKPQWISREINDYRLCFAADNKLLIIDPNQRRCQTVTYQGNAMIDRVTFFWNCLFIWSKDNKAVSFYKNGDDKWKLITRVKWRDPTAVLVLDFSVVWDLLLLPAVQLSHDDCLYVFSVSLKKNFSMANGNPFISCLPKNPICFFPRLKYSADAYIAL
ncbi:uncharacterized protein LOC142352277 isoform X2 [Convolutriloba macropyga]|uniref:uncharacterized protein LOC142352277 isoform X2 n=1 Tax=Convolutriloba macropyga TaxID=536237 RepID=UPI003F520209